MFVDSGMTCIAYIFVIPIYLCEFLCQDCIADYATVTKGGVFDVHVDTDWLFIIFSLPYNEFQIVEFGNLNK